MSDNVLGVYRRALTDYRLALGMELQSRRTSTQYSFEQLASRSGIPAETLRAYENGTSLPQLLRLDTIAEAYGVALFDILTSTAEYIYRASGEPVQSWTTASADRVALRAVVLYCGVTPAQLRAMEARPPGSQDPYRD